MNSYVESVIQGLKARNPWEKEFLQAAEEVLISITPVIESEPRYIDENILERIVEPERVILFRVPWVDDRGSIHVNRGYRVEFNSAIGPYKGGLRFHPSVTLSGLKFLGFEQIFKNSLTGLPMGGGKGGSDFNPNGKSDGEVMRFCQSFMTELSKHIGPNTDVPAGDIGVGGREIGFLYGQYKKIRNHFTGVLTGKGLGWGGSLIRPEATGFGAIYFTKEMLKVNSSSLDGKKIALSGFGNVAWGAALKAAELGAKIVTISGPDGYIYEKNGLSKEQIEYMLIMRASCNDRVQDFSDRFGSEFHQGKKPWEAICDIAMPCAIQNELDKNDVQNLINNGCKMIVEVSNMGCTADAVILANEKITYAPGKAVNAGGVAVSGLEMSQNSMRLRWKAEQVDDKLQDIMINIHKSVINAAEEYGVADNYVAGANIAGFIKVADAMIDQGVV